MNPKPIEQAKTPDLTNSLPAIRRAAQKARELARITPSEQELETAYRAASAESEPDWNLADSGGRGHTSS